MRLDPELKLQADAERYTLPRFLDDVVSRHAARTALRFEGVDTSFGELERAARRVARALVSAGVVKGARVAVLMANRPEWVISAFAVSMTGAVLVPVNTFATPAERDYILRHSDASVLLMQRSLLRRDYLGELTSSHEALGRCPAGRIRCEALPQLRRVICLGLEEGEGAVEAWSELLADRDDPGDLLLDAIAGEIVPADDAVIIYTSGTTSHPKGVLHSQRAPVIQSWRFAELMGLTPDDRVLTAQPFFWTAGMTMSLGAALAAGACLILQEAFEPGAALELVEAEKATTLHAWPHQEKSMAEHDDARSRDLSSLRRIEFSSPLAPIAGLEADEWGTYGSYGLSETFTLAAAIPASAPAALRRGTSGVALPGMSLRVVDPDTGVEKAAGEPGEIAVRGATFMRGYYKVEPELYLDAEGYFRTQDGGSIGADGRLHWTGRLSNLIKTGGANVSPLEIEDALVDYPGLKAAAAVGVPHPSLGEVIVLCAVELDGHGIDGEELRTFLRERLAAYKVPRLVMSFKLADVSFTGSQKLKVEPLKDLLMRRLAAEGIRIEGHDYEA